VTPRLKIVVSPVRVRVSPLENRLLPGSFRLRLVDYEPDVMRELVANAFAHRDWEQPSIIEIAHSPDALVVTSPGIHSLRSTLIDSCVRALNEIESSRARSPGCGSPKVPGWASTPSTER
jgi:hypothetical protein